MHVMELGAIGERCCGDRVADFVGFELQLDPC